MHKNKTIKTMGAVMIMGLLSGLLGGCSFGWKTSYIYENSEKYVAGDREISDKIETVEVDYLSGNVTVVESGSDKVVITETTNKPVDDQRKVHSWVDGTTLRVRYCESAENLELNNLGKKLTLAIPAGAALDTIDVKVSSGNIDATCSANHIKIGTSSGNVKVSQKGSSERLSAKTSSGNVDLVAEKADELIISVSSGNIQAKVDSAKQVTGKTSSGNCEYTFATVPESSELNASSGNITVSLPKDADLTANLKTSSGKVFCDQAMNRDGNLYTSGNGQNQMKVKTSSGHIRLQTIEG